MGWLVSGRTGIRFVLTTAIHIQDIAQNNEARGRHWEQSNRILHVDNIHRGKMGRRRIHMPLLDVSETEDLCWKCITGAKRARALLTHKAML